MKNVRNMKFLLIDEEETSKYLYNLTSRTMLKWTEKQTIGKKNEIRGQKKSLYETRDDL